MALVLKRQRLSSWRVLTLISGLRLRGWGDILHYGNDEYEARQDFMATATKKRNGKERSTGTTAIHAAHENGERHAVTVLNLHVLIVPDGKHWFAQGLEIDYAVQGKSVADAKKQFEFGFRATIHQNLKIFGHIDHMLRVSPTEVWREYLNTPKAQKTYTHTSMHEVVPELANVLQFEQIEYAELRLAAVCV